MSTSGENGEKSLRNQALAQLRETRLKLETEHPELMKTLRRQIDNLEKAAPAISVDRRKNISAVMKFLETCPNPGIFRDEIKSFLSEQRDH